MKSIVCRVDGSRLIGMGHIMRCIAISEMIEQHFKITFAVFRPEANVLREIQKYKFHILEVDDVNNVTFAKNFDIVIIDGYWYDHTYVKQLHQTGKIVIQIDDIPSNEYYCNILINHAMSVTYSKSIFHSSTRVLTGPRFAMLRKSFLDAAADQPIIKVLESITVSMGGADPLNYTGRIFNCLTSFCNQHRIQLNILIGPAFQHISTLNKMISEIAGVKIYTSLNSSEIKQLFDNTSLLICPASNIVYEACAVGVPAIVFLTADNQLNMYNGLVDSKAVAAGGKLSQLNDTELTQVLSELLSGYETILGYLPNQRKLIDGQSGKRIKEEILALCN